MNSEALLLHHLTGHYLCQEKSFTRTMYQTSSIPPPFVGCSARGPAAEAPVTFSAPALVTFAAGPLWTPGETLTLELHDRGDPALNRSLEELVLDPIDAVDFRLSSISPAFGPHLSALVAELLRASVEDVKRLQAPLDHDFGLC